MITKYTRWQKYTGPTHPANMVFLRPIGANSLWRSYHLPPHQITVLISNVLISKGVAVLYTSSYLTPRCDSVSACQYRQLTHQLLTWCREVSASPTSVGSCRAESQLRTTAVRLRHRHRCPTAEQTRQAADSATADRPLTEPMAAHTARGALLTGAARPDRHVTGVRHQAQSMAREEARALQPALLWYCKAASVTFSDFLRQMFIVLKILLD